MVDTKYKKNGKEGLLRTATESRPFRSINPNEGEAEALFADAPLLMAENYQALVFGATGEPLDASLPSVSGHTHEARLTRLFWRSLGSFSFVNRGGQASNPDSFRIVSTSPLRHAAGLLWLPTQAAETLSPRLRVSHAAPGVVDLVTVRVDFRQQGTGALLASRAFVFSTYRARSHEWLDGEPVDVRGATPDAGAAARLPLRWELFAHVSAGGNVPFIHELQLGQWGALGGNVGQ